MIDEQNNTYQEMWNEIVKHNKITICTHINTDGDTICAALALKELIKLNTDIIDIKISGEKYPRYLDFLEPNDIVDDKYFNNSLKIVVDTSTKKRIYDKRVVTKEAIKFDHHPHEGNWLLGIGGDHWPATGQLLWDMIEELGLKVNKKICEYIFISIWTDTEKMTQRNITKRTHDVMKALKIDQKKMEKLMELSTEEKKIIDSAKIETIGDVTYSLTDSIISNDIYRQYVNGIYDKSKTEIVLVGTFQNDHYRFGIRSHGNRNVSKYAKKMGGGGHFASSGFKIGDVENVEKIIKVLIKEINNE